MTFGTESIQKYTRFWSWEPIRNSGEAISNQFGVAIDMPAGPSELLIVADDSPAAALSPNDYHPAKQR
jgi:histidinol dehydrogenase